MSGIDCTDGGNGSSGMSWHGELRPLAGSSNPSVGESGRIGSYSGSSRKATFFFGFVVLLFTEWWEGVGEDILVDKVDCDKQESTGE